MHDPSPDRLDDRDLLAKLEGHRAALTAFVRLRIGPALSARESCSDIVQSVCRELFEQRDRFEFRGDPAFRAWLFAAASHKLLQKVRYHRAAPRDVARESTRPSADDELLAAYSSCVTPSREVSAREQVQRFEAAFARLSHDDREVISLVRIAGLPHAEVAARLNCTVDRSRTLLRRALVRLAGLLAAGATPADD